jgi:hypothetical protein
MKLETRTALISLPPLALAARHKERMLQRGAKLVWNIVLSSRPVLLALMMISGTTAAAATISVTSTNDGGAGSLRQAIASAIAGDTITFSLPANSTINLTSGALSINKNLTIEGPGADQLTVRRGTADQGVFRIFTITGGINVAITGLTIANGYNSNGSGGGISVGSGSTLTLSHSTITGHTSFTTTVAYGGAIQNVGTLTVATCIISGNLAFTGTAGGGGLGGGIYNSGTLTVTNSTIAGNSCDESGGGLFNTGTATITNTTISGNSKSGASSSRGGGIYNGGGTLTMINSTVTDNSTGSEGGGIFGGNSGTLNVKNTIIAMNSATNGPDVAGTVVSQGYILIGNTSGTTITTGGSGTTAGNQLNVNPLLGPLQNNGGPTLTHALRSGSPAIEGGHSSGSRTDQRGLARPVDDPSIGNASGGDGADIGAYEVQADQLPGCNPISRVVSNKNDSGAGSLRAVIANVCAGTTITFADNVRGAIPLTSGELMINKSLTISGPGANLLSVQRSTDSGTAEFRIFNIGPANIDVTLSGLTVANGKPPGGSNGAGIVNQSGGTLTVMGCAVSGNTASGNGAQGGGIFNLGKMILTDSTISGNSAPGGGGIENLSIPGLNSTLTITNSTISGNSAAGTGAGIENFRVVIPNGPIPVGTVNLTNCTISGNPAGNSGGGIFNQSGNAVNVRNTIIALNTAPTGPDVSGALTSENFNLIGSSAGATISPAQFSDQIGVTATQLNLSALQNNGGPTQTHALLSGSFAIDKGHSSGSPTDQRGVNRPVDQPGIGNASGGDGADIGAFEFNPNPPTPTPSPTPTATATPTPGSLGNVSTRLQVGTGNNVLFAGFIIQGNASKTVLIRSAGPSLTPFDVPGALGNPQLELHDAHNTIGTNDNWQTTQIGGVITSDQVAAIQNSGAPPSDPAEPAIIATLPAGSYTAIVQGVDGAQGVATVEVYDLSPNNGATLANISTRGFIQTGANVMIGGFIVVGQSSRVLIRATGPSLIPFGVNNALANPQLELHDANGTLAGNDDWQTTQLGGIITSDQSAAIQNSGLAPSDPAESAIIATLAPGSYTAIAQGVNGGTGVGIIEVFALP